MRFIDKKAQSTLEYAVLVTIVIAAFIVMQTYFKRGFQGRWKATVDDFGEQYDPAKVNSEIKYSLVSNSDTQIAIGAPAISPSGSPGYYTKRTDTSNSVETKTGNTVVGP